MKVKGFHINVDELAELLHISIEEYRHRLRNDRLTIGQILAVSDYMGLSLEATMDYFFADFDAKRFNLSRKIIREGKKNA
nr:MAG TPA: Regulatory protein-modification, helix-turn-helix, transcriptional regulato, DNA [Caudoviricetes sp.]